MVPHMRVAVAYNRPTEVVAGRPEDLKTDLQLESAAGFVADALAAAGHAVERIEADWDLLRACQAARPEIIFNLVEGFASTNAHEHIAPCIFDFLGIPYTGADPVNLLMIRDKVYTKDILRAHGFPMAPHRLLMRVDDGVDELRFPLILKPVREEGSLGIQYDSVVRSPAELRERLHGLFAVFRQPILAEKFIVGREFSVGVLGNATPRPLTSIEFKFRGTDPLRSFRSYEYKWEEGPEVMVEASDLDHEIAAALESLAVKAHMILRCRDYSRADFRVAADGSICFLEHNSNPGLGPNSDGFSNTFPLMAELSGLDYGTLMQTILTLAVERSGGTAATP
jgi:D-alanine-D-alanine ligase